jgi:hypothetical protein
VWLGGFQRSVQVHLSQEFPHPFGHHDHAKLHDDEYADEARHGRCHGCEGYLETGRVNEGPDEGHEGHQEHDDAHNAALALVGDTQVVQVHLVVQEEFGVLVVNPVADPADPPVDLDLHGVPTQGLLADDASLRVYPSGLLGRKYTPGYG